MNAAGLYAGSVTGTSLYAAGLVGLVLVVLAGVMFAAWRERDHTPANHPTNQVDPAPLPDTDRTWLTVDTRVVHDVLGLGTALDTIPAHAPYAGQVLVQFDTLSGPRWVRARELDPAPTPRDLDDLWRKVVAARPRLAAVDGAQRSVWPRECGPSGHLGSSCYWHGAACGQPNPLAYGDRSYCCATCPTRRTRPTTGGQS